jgi:DNA invertase Pin-like site-specific DNA recombinase
MINHAVMVKEHRYISYLRVSTQKQGRSGLGLEAQREAVRSYLHAQGNGEPMAEYVEVESGKDNDRPVIAQALADCRMRRAVLVIAKLDRLSRNVAFLANLMDAGVEFVAVDNPHANKFTVHVLSAAAQHEREQTSIRTRDALAAAKARGVKLGNPNPPRGDAAGAKIAREAVMRRARQFAEDLRPYIAAARSEGHTSLERIASYLTAQGVSTPRGGKRWTATAVARVLRYYGSEVQ